MDTLYLLSHAVKHFDFRTHVLGQKMVEENKKKGLIPQNIDLLCDRIIASEPASDKTFGYGGNLSQDFLESIGIKESFFTKSSRGFGNAVCIDSIHITDLFLIHCTAYYGMIRGSESSKPRLSFIPLEYVEACALVFGQNYSGYVSPTYRTIEKDPVKGAIIGGMVGGTTGDIIGAAANTGTKTVLYTKGGSYNDNEYALLVKIKGEEEQILRKFYECTNDEANISLVDQKNQRVQRLIDRAKSLDDDAKMNLAKEENIKRWKRAGLCQYCGGKLKGIFVKKCISCGQKKDY